MPCVGRRRGEGGKGGGIRTGWVVEAGEGLHFGAKAFCELVKHPLAAYESVVDCLLHLCGLLELKVGEGLVARGAMVGGFLGSPSVLTKPQVEHVHLRGREHMMERGG